MSGSVTTPFHVLLIVDSPDERAELRQMLLAGSPRYYNFTEVETGRAGIRTVLAALSTPPDCVLLDYNLPDTDALAVLDALHAGGELTMCPVVVLTGSLERGALALRAGAQEFFGRGWATPESVTRAIDSAVERHGSTRARMAAEAALHRNETIFSKIIEQAPGGVYVVDAQFRVVQMNAESRPFFASAEPLIGRDFDEALEIVWGPEVGPQIASIFRHTLVTGERYVSPRFFGQRHDIGVEQAFEWEVQRITLPDGQHGVVCHFKDVTERERAEAARRDTEERLRLAIAGSDLGTWHWDIRTGALNWSERCLKIFGIPQGTAMSREKFLDVLHPEDRARADDAVRLALEDGSDYRIEFRNIWPDGSVHWAVSLGRASYDASGEPTRMEGIALDVTERKRADEARHESERNYRALVRASSDVVYRMSPDWSEMHLLDGNEFVVDTAAPRVNWVEEYLYADDQPQVLAVIREAIRTKSPFEMEHRVRRVDGSAGWTFSRAIPLLDAAGEIVEWFGTASDVTARKRAEEDRRLLASIVENSRDFIGIADTHGNPIYGNRAALELVGVQDLEQLRRTKIIDYFLPAQRPFIEEVVLPAVATEGRWSGELTMQHFVTGASIPVWYDLFRVDDTLTGQPVNFATVTRDLTESKRAEEALREKAHFLQRIAEVTPGVLHVHDLAEQRAVFINRSVTTLLGYSPDEVRAMGADATPRLMHPEDLPQFEEYLARVCALADGEVAQFEFRMRDHVGAWHWFLTHGSVFTRDAAGAARQMIGVASEITARKQAELAARASEERLRKSISVQNVGVLFFKLDGHMLDANGALERMTGYTAEELRRITDWAQLTPPEFMDVTRRAAAELAEHGVTAPYEKQWIRKDGSRFWGLFSPTRLSGSGGESECVEFTVDITETKRAGEQLRLHRQLLEAIVNHLPAAVALVRGSDLTFQMVNPGYQALSPGKQLIGKTISEVWPEQTPRIAQRCRHVLETGDPFEAVDERYEIRRGDDGPFETAYFSWSMRRINLPNEDEPGLLLTIWETTARKGVELALLEKSNRYNALFDSIDQGFCLLEMMFEGNKAKDFRFLEVNPAFAKHSGLTDAKGKRALELVPDNDAHWFELYGKVALTGDPTRIEQHTQALGRWYDVFAFRVGAPEDRRVAVLFTDITERKKGHDAVARLAAIVECSYDALFSEDLDGIVTTWNRGAEQIFGYSPDEIIGTSILRLIPEDGHSAEHDLQRQIVAGGRGGSFEATRRAKDGREFKASITVSPMTNAAGRIIGTSRAIRDVTERELAAAGLREAKEAAESANRSKDRFLAALSHELRTPLTPVLLVSEVHAKSLKLSDDLREDFEMIHRNIVLEAQLIDDLLDVSRIQQGKMRFDFKLVDVHEGIDRALEMMRSEIEEKEIGVRQELSTTPATLEADAARLRQVLCNLLRNAVTFSPHGGTITVRTAHELGGLRISMADTGPGIAAENLQRIFQPFEQVVAQQQSEHRGLGLGLAISGSIVAAHRGRIWAESSGPGQGSTLNVWLPL